MTTENGALSGKVTPKKIATGGNAAPMTTSISQIDSTGLDLKANSRTDDSVNRPCFTSKLKVEEIVEQVAKLVQAGHFVYQRRSGDFLVCKYGLSHWCPDHAELQHFAIQLGVS